MQLQLRQISKVVYEAIRAYEGTVGMADKGSWETTTQANRDEVLTKVDALLRGQPHAPTSIRPTDQVRAKLLSGIVGAFVLVYNPPVTMQAPAVQEAPPPPIPAETFENPDSVVQTAPLGGGKVVPIGVAQSFSDAAGAGNSAGTGNSVIETKHYADGTSATGVAPLPDRSVNGAEQISDEEWARKFQSQNSAQDATGHPVIGEPSNVGEALAKADANIAEANKARAEEE